MADPNYFTLPSPPFDTISSVHYSPTEPDELLVSSWDTTVRFYQVENGDKPSELKSKYDHRAAILACCFSDKAHGFSGGLDASVRMLDLATEKMTTLGTHDNAVSSMVYSRDANVLITGSWDCSLRFWDPRSPASSLTGRYQTPERVYALDIPQPSTNPAVQTTNTNMLVVAMASRLFSIYDIRKMDVPAQQRESSLKFMTRSLGVMSTGEGYATASVEGRIAVEYFDPSPEVQVKKYAFKCHRTSDVDVDYVFPVNALAFHPTYNTFASAGSDSTVSIWDHKVKKRLRQYPKFSNPVSSLSFNCDGTRLAIGVGYMWDQGSEGLKGPVAGVAGETKTAERAMPEVGIRKLGDEVKPRNWTPGSI